MKKKWYQCISGIYYFVLVGHKHTAVADCFLISQTCRARLTFLFGEGQREREREKEKEREH